MEIKDFFLVANFLYFSTIFFCGENDPGNCKAELWTLELHSWILYHFGIMLYVHQ